MITPINVPIGNADNTNNVRKNEKIRSLVRPFFTNFAAVICSAIKMILPTTLPIK